MSFCVVIAGRLPGVEDDHVVWAAIARGFRVEPAEFVAKTLPRLPMVVKQGLEQAAATAMTESLTRLGIDARAFEESGELALFERDGATKGPVPFASLGAFIHAGERYRRQGEGNWSTWTVPASGAEPGPAPPPPLAPFEKIDASPRPAASPDEARRDFPRPPSFHWFVVALLSLVTLGTFAWVWLLVQASWVRKIDRFSSARKMLIVALVLDVVGLLATVAAYGTHAGPAGAPFWLIGGIITIVASFSMANSVTQAARRVGVPLKFGGITLFFFHTYYLQGVMTWLARWKDTGQVASRPPKAVFWCLLCMPWVLAICAAIAVPQYQNYLLRSQVAEGFALAEPFKEPILAYYRQHGKYPHDNAAMGLKDPEAIHGQYTESVKVSDGSLWVTFGEHADRTIRGRWIVVNPLMEPSGITWECVSRDIPLRLLPAACQ